MRRTILLAILITAGGFAQTAEKLSFEVASIKPAPPPAAGMMRVMMGGGPGTNDPGRINFMNVNLKMILTRAYNVKAYQISGPGWLDTERFDIAAKIPEGATKEQFLLMLQGLLAERFKLKLHREKKDLPAYALIVGKNGPKLKESSAEAGVDTFNAAAPPPPPPPGAGTFTAGVRGPLPMGKDGFPQMPPGRGGMFIMMNGGRARLNANQQTMAGLADMLMGQLDRPVLDMTELTKKYDITLEWAPEGRPMGMMGGGMPPPPPPPGGGPGGGEIGLPGPSAPDGQAGPSIFTAVQEQLGLKLEARKAPVEILVIDGGEKVPSEN
jgi:uncharacterized protein (TIGR03435 family)